jgi:predicted enzyme related to lactoylglutathione lyase
MDKVQHFEIPADDLGRAKKFYEKSFGWKTVDWPMPDGSKYVGLYTGPVNDDNTWKEPGFINGGMIQRGGEAFPISNPVITAVVQDIEKVLLKVKAAGGSIFKEAKEIPGLGKYAYIKDSEGNIMGVWQEFKKEK